MSADEVVAMGTVIRCERSNLVRVRLDSGLVVLAYRAGKLIKHKISLLEGDKVEVRFSAHGGFDRGRVTYRFK